MAVNLDLTTSAVTTYPPGEVRLIWGTQLPVYPVGRVVSKFGQFGVTYVAQGVFAPSIYRSKFGHPVVISGERNVPANLNLTENISTTDKLGVRNIYWGIRPIGAVSCGIVTRFGVPTISNAAQGIFAKSITPATPSSNLLISHFYANPVLLNALSQPVNFKLIQPVPTDRPTVDFPFVVTFTVDYINPKSIYQGGFGSPAIRNRAEYVKPVGVDYRRVGDPSVRNLQLFIKPNGFSGRTLGGPTVALASSYISPIGFTQRSIGLPTVYNRISVINPGSVVNRTFGVPTFSVNFDKIISITGFNSRKFGTSFVGNFTNYVTVEGFNSFRSGTNTRVSRPATNLDAMNFTMMLF